MAVDRCRGGAGGGRPATVRCARWWWAAAAICLLGVVGCGTGGAGGGQEAQGRPRTIRMVAWTYQPSESMAVSEQNPHPRQALTQLIAEWERLHPGVRIELIRQPQEQSAYIAWIHTQAKGGTIPEIIFHWPDAQILVQSGWVIPIDEYYDRPNPYVPGNARWRDLIQPVCIEPPFKALDNRYYFVPMDLYLSALAYNKDIFAEAGIADPPETWTEFMDDLDRIRAAGYEPFWGMALWSNWPRDLMAYYFHDDETFRLLDVLPTDGKISIEEGMRGAVRGINTVDSARFREYLRVMKEWSRGWKRGFSLSKFVEPASLFRLNRLGITWESATSLAAMADDPFMRFQTGLMWFPAMHADTSPLASGRRPPLMAIPGTCYFITASARRNGLADLCADWLMFLTAPENIERLTQEETAVKVPPSVEGAQVDPILQPLMDIGYDMINVVPMPWGATPEAIDNFDRIFELYLLDKLTLEEALERFREWDRKGLEQALHMNRLLPNPKDRWDPSRW